MIGKILAQYNWT